MPAVPDVRDGFFSAHLEAHPEEGSTLGLRGYAGRLSIPSREAAEHELSRLRETLRDLARARAECQAPLTLEDALDLDAVQRIASFHERWIAGDGDASWLEIAALPNAALQHGALHAKSAEDVALLAARARDVARALDAHASNLRRGVRDGRAPDRAVVAMFATRILPGAATATAALASDVAARLLAEAEGSGVLRAEVSAIEREAQRLADDAKDASDAFRGFGRMLVDEIAPHARADVKLGAEEVELRLRDAMGLEASVDELVTLARAKLEAAHASLVEHVRALGDRDVTTVDDTREALQRVLEPRPSTVEEAVSLYQQHVTAATRFVVERALVHVPDALALAFEPLPPGLADGSSLTNWPAPLLDREGRGHALYSTDLTLHPVVQTKNLAVHEGIPGHYLQSTIWQRGAPSPVRFLGVKDDVAMARSYFGTMVSVEGWAVHMEQLLLDEGFYEAGPERIFFAFCDAIRAMRVLLDLELHARGMEEEEAVRMVMRTTLTPEPWARAQLVRAKRMPLQSLTYLVGAWEIARLRGEVGGATSSLEFHRALLDVGPVPPSHARRAFRVRSEDAARRGANLARSG